MAHEPADTASVFDFLFVDHARIALFNAQFTGMGSMRQIIESESTTGAKGGAVDAAVARARFERRASERLEKAYDTQWVEPLSFLDYAQERDMLKSDLASARVGDLVRVRVGIDFLNLASLRRVWSELAGERSGSGGRKHRRDGGKLFADKDAELGLRLFGALDQPMIMVFRGEEGRLWSAVIKVGSTVRIDAVQGVQHESPNRRGTLRGASEGRRGGEPESVIDFTGIACRPRLS